MKFERRDLDLGELTAILDRASLSAEERDKLKTALDTLAFLTSEIGTKGMTIERLRRMVFGARTEKTEKIFPDAPTEAGGGSQPRGDDTTAASAQPREQRPGTVVTGRTRIRMPRRFAWCTAHCIMGIAVPNVCEASSTGSRSRRCWCASAAWRRWSPRATSSSGCAATCAARCSRPRRPRGRGTEVRPQRHGHDRAAQVCLRAAVSPHREAAEEPRYSTARSHAVGAGVGGGRPPQSPRFTN